MITTLLVMMLMSALLVGFTTVVMSDQRYRFIDRDRGQAFYAASAGVEKLTADLGNLFFANVAPTAAQVTALANNPPAITGVQFLKPDNTSGYTIASQAPAPLADLDRPYAGLVGLMTRTIDVTARTAASGEVHLQRLIETVAIPVFQFGMFSDVDLSFFAGPNFNFGGRVHTNGNLFLAEGGGATLTLRDKVTAVKEVVRKQLQNTVLITTSTHTGTISQATAPNAFRNLATTEGSVTDGLNPLTFNEPTWHTISLSTYNGYIRNGRTGAKVLNLPLITLGGANTDLVRRPVVNENVTNPELFGERYFPRVSLRILLSDTAADITNLPSVTNTPPVQLDGDWRAAAPNNGTAYGPVDATHAPIARTIGPVSTTVNGALAVNAATIPVPANALPNGFRPGGLGLNNLTLTPLAGVPAPITCSGRTTTGNIQFTGCLAHLAAPVNSTITAVVDGVTVSTVVNSAAIANSATIRVASIAGFGNELYAG